MWGEESLELVQDRARSAEGKRRGPDLVKLLREKNSWEEVLRDDATTISFEPSSEGSYISA